MKRICLQAGHKGRTSGATGAPGEKDWTTEITPKIAKKLRELGFEVYETDAYAYNDSKVTGTDWDLFLSLHYDADVYNDRGGFADYPEPSTDHATKESQRITKVLTEVYFPQTGIPNKPQRSNKNTRYYYMWKHLSKNTPCVLLEAGVGWRVPEDHHTLHLNQDKVVNAIANGINKALKGEAMPDQYEKCRLDRDAWWTNLNNLLKAVGLKTESDNYDHVKKVTNEAVDKVETVIQDGKKCEVAREDLGEKIKKARTTITDLEEKLSTLEASKAQHEGRAKRLAEQLKECQDRPENPGESAFDKTMKELMRWVVIGLIPSILTYLGTIQAEWALTATLVLKLIDKAIHEYGKNTGNEWLTRGVTRF